MTELIKINTIVSATTHHDWCVGCWLLNWKYFATACSGVAKLPVQEYLRLALLVKFTLTLSSHSTCCCRVVIIMTRWRHNKRTRRIKVHKSANFKWCSSSSMLQSANSRAAATRKKPLKYSPPKISNSEPSYTRLSCFPLSFFRKRKKITILDYILSKKTQTKFWQRNTLCLRQRNTLCLDYAFYLHYIGVAYLLFIYNKL